MTNGSTTLEVCYVLHRRAYRETSLLVEAFSRRHGRVGLVARGVRQRRSRWSGILEPFQPLSLSWQGRGELGTLTGAESQTRVESFRGRRLYAGFYINELLLRLLARNDPHAGLFDGYQATVRKLAGDNPADPTLRIFEKYLLASIGYGIITDVDADTGEPIQPGKEYAYIPELGPSTVINPSGCQVSGGTLIALANECFDDETTLRESKQLMRFLLAPHLGDRRLETRVLYATPP